MQTFKEFLIELFDAPPAKWQKMKNNFYRFNIDDKIYVVRFNEPFMTKKKIHTEIDFGQVVNNEIVFTMTGGGDELKVLNTVKDIINDYVKENDPPGLKFSARKDINTGKDSKSRHKVYLRMVKKFLPASEWETEIKDGGHEVYFLITKK